MTKTVIANLYIHNPDVMSDQEIKELQRAKQRQVDRINAKQIKKVPDDSIKPKETKQKGQKKMRNPIDMYGQTINIGNYINYPVRKGSNTYMRTAKVIKVRQRNDHLDRPKMVLDVAVAIAPRVWERAKNKNWEQDVRVRRVTVSRPHRATILPERYITSDKRYRALADY